MDNSSLRKTGNNGTSGIINYLDASTRPSLYRNGKVFTKRDPDGNDYDTQGLSLTERKMTMFNARLGTQAERRTLETNGFELQTRPLTDRNLDFFNQTEVVEKYYSQCANLVHEATGARAFAFDHNIRSALARDRERRISGGQKVQQPIHITHGDYTLTSAPQRLRDLTQPAGSNDTLRLVLGDGQSLIDQQMVERALADGGRFAIINVWRNIAREPVATHPLALCDAQSVQPEDLVVFEIHYSDRVGENYFARHSERHDWYYYPAISPEEALLIKQWDSAGKLAQSSGKQGDASDPGIPCTFSFHGSFDDLATPANAPDRISIEVRCIVLYD